MYTFFKTATKTASLAAAYCGAVAAIHYPTHEIVLKKKKDLELRHPGEKVELRYLGKGLFDCALVTAPEKGKDQPDMTPAKAAIKP